MGIGAVLRLVSDASGAVLQVDGRIALDNFLLATSELIWAGLATAMLLKGEPLAEAVGAGACMSGLFLWAGRMFLADRSTRLPIFFWRFFQLSTAGHLLSFGAIVTIAQLADYLYAPTDFILINRLIDARTVAVYAPAVQIDAGLLLLVTAIAGVLLPRAAIAHAAGDAKRIEAYYARGTLASLGILLIAGAGIYLISPWLFRAWFHDSMPATRAILPLVLVHTIVGGSSAVGRSILLGMGKVQAFTAAVLIAGGANVMLSYVFVRYLHMGLPGIILGTIVAVVGRCAIWMPWYVMRQLRSNVVTSS